MAYLAQTAKGVGKWGSNRHMHGKGVPGVQPLEGSSGHGSGKAPEAESF